VGYPPSGENFVKKWVVDEENGDWQVSGIEKTSKKLCGNSFCDKRAFHTDRGSRMPILWFLDVLGRFWSHQRWPRPSLGLGMVSWIFNDTFWPHFTLFG
jgi:hypothetical protein